MENLLQQPPGAWAGQGFTSMLDLGESFLAEVLDAMPEAVVLTHGTRVLHSNREFERLFGYTAGECVGQELDELVLPDGRLHESEMLLHMVHTTGRTSIETERRSAAGELIKVAVLLARLNLGGEARGLFITYRDIRRQKQEEARLQHTALHDGLTGLANRGLFLDRVRLTMARLKRRPDRGFAVLFIDLDGFKQVNDTLGHAGGDRLLLEISQRLTRCVRPQDTVARFGGDEFALLLDETAGATEAMQVARRVLLEIERRVDLEDGPVHVSASLGLAVANPLDARAEDILRHADAAMYEAKARGKRQCVLWAPEPSPIEGAGSQ